MALVPKSCIKLTDDCGVFQFEDKTNYGTPEENREQGANVLLVAHVDEEGKEDFLSVDSEPVLTKLVYDVYNTKDGHYLFEILRFRFYDNNTVYYPEEKDINGVIVTYANVIYYQPTNKFYKAINPAFFINIAPDDVNANDYWEEIIDFTVDSIRTNTNILVLETHDINDCRSRKCVRNYIIGLGCNCTDQKKLVESFRRESILASARSLADNQQYNKAESNIRLLEKMCPSC